ncbi:hypothetical protein K7432_013620 [Basidiobolus ranarum]|uniref:Uncharacterized protein n=1 Tax=Basidiobolus ranarum TaxID=34480 RepID=A0ABR2VQK9_9FUNG
MVRKPLLLQIVVTFAAMIFCYSPSAPIHAYLYVESPTLEESASPPSYRADVDVFKCCLRYGCANIAGNYNSVWNSGDDSTTFLFR